MSSRRSHLRSLDIHRRRTWIMYSCNWDVGLHIRRSPLERGSGPNMAFASKTRKYIKPRHFHFYRMDVQCTPLPPTTLRPYDPTTLQTPRYSYGSLFQTRLSPRFDDPLPFFWISHISLVSQLLVFPIPCPALRLSWGAATRRAP